MKLENDLSHLKYLLSDNSLQLLPEYEQRVEVGNCLSFLPHLFYVLCFLLLSGTGSVRSSDFKTHIPLVVVRVAQVFFVQMKLSGFRVI